MKIQRFNESSELYSESIVRDIIDDRNILMDKAYNYFIYKLPEILPDVDEDEVAIQDLIYKNYKFIINYSTDYDFENSYVVEDVDEMIAFFNNPKLLKNSKKYNI